MYPEHKDAYTGSWGMLSKAQQDQEFRSGTEAYNAIQNGRVDLAKERLTQQIQLTKDAGKPTKNLEAMLSTLDSDPTKVAGQLGLVLSSVDPDRWAKMGAEQRAQALAPSKLAESEAMATIKTIEAQFAPDKYTEELKKQRAELVKTMTETANTDATRQKTLAEIQAIKRKEEEAKSGKIPAEDRPKAEDALRTEYLKNAAPMIATRDAYRKILAASPNAQGDLALIIGFNKVLDEGSVVKETEAATVRNARALSETVSAYIDRLKNGEQLTEQQRRELKAEAGKLMKAMERHEKEIRTGITRIAKGRGLDTENIFYDPSGKLANAAENEGVKGAADGALPAPISKVFDYRTGALVPASTTATTGKVVEVDY